MQYSYSYSDVDHLPEEKVSRFRFPLVSMAIGGPLTIDLSLVASSHGTEGGAVLEIKLRLSC